MKVIALGEIADKFLMDDLPERGIVIEATKEELQSLPPILYRDVEVTEKKPPRNCDRFRDVDEAYNQFKRYVMRENPACVKPSPLYTLWDGLKWVLGFADGEVGKPDAPKKVWLVFHEEHEAGGGTNLKGGGKPDERAIREVVECAARVLMPPSDSTDGAWLEWARSLQAKARRALGMEVRK